MRGTTQNSKEKPRLKLLRNCNAREAFGLEWSREYNDIREGLFHQIYLLNWNAYIISQIKDSTSSIGRTILENSYQLAVLLIYKLVLDKQYSLTLKKFRDLIRHNLVFDKHKRELDRRLMKIDFDGKIKRIATMFKKERHEVIAHFSSGSSGIYFVTPEKRERREAILKTIEESCKLINQHYDVLKVKGCSTKEVRKMISTNAKANCILEQLVEVEQTNNIKDFLRKS